MCLKWWKVSWTDVRFHVCMFVRIPLIQCRFLAFSIVKQELKKHCNWMRVHCLVWAMIWRWYFEAPHFARRHAWEAAWVMQSQPEFSGSVAIVKLDLFHFDGNSNISQLNKEDKPMSKTFMGLSKNHRLLCLQATSEATCEVFFGQITPCSRDLHTWCPKRRGPRQ